MSSPFNDEEVEEVFRFFDTDNSGAIAAEELLFALKTFSSPAMNTTKLTLADATEMIAKAKKPTDEAAGFLAQAEEKVRSLTGNEKNDAPCAEEEPTMSLPQFKDLIKNTTPNCGSPQEVAGAFKLFDRDHKGKLNKADLLAVYYEVCGSKSLSEDEAKRYVSDMFDVADRDGDGVINLEEWRMIIARGGKGKARPVAAK